MFNFKMLSPLHFEIEVLDVKHPKGRAAIVSCCTDAFIENCISQVDNIGVRIDGVTIPIARADTDGLRVGQTIDLNNWVIAKLVVNKVLKITRLCDPNNILFK